MKPKALPAKAGGFLLPLNVIHFEPQNIEVKKIVLFLQRLLLFEIPCSIFDIQKAKQAKAVRLKGEGSKPDEWNNATERSSRGFETAVMSDPRRKAGYIGPKPLSRNQTKKLLAF